MKILAVDTALGACSVALLDGERVLAHRFMLMERGHAEALAPMVDEAMRAAGAAFAEIDRLAVTTGPGTFTGQRVGLAFMRGLRVALEKPLAGITTLEAMAAAARDEAGVEFAAALHDARRGEVYAYAGSRAQAILPVSIALFEDAVKDIHQAMAGKNALAFAGTAAEAAAREYERLGGRATLTAVRQPDALWVARLAARLPEPAEVPRPLYLRAPDAKLPGTK
ncbi:MAG TPA: tRNA (adenosine(37)-N6)-threonylcarbamoyltransferase complex dimerization subunit type 1 TsaB [Rhizomicrobium sp.]|nr:tRNA (adenosine(37)-N6)-threonylcarbamoyltransferase complex dimerization subunit type 1 TsaB [Rhizomicrobium sp.]